jgi:hypothetical protein
VAGPQTTGRRFRDPSQSFAVTHHASLIHRCAHLSTPSYFSSSPFLSLSGTRLLLFATYPLIRDQKAAGPTMTLTKRRGITVEVFPWQGISIQLQAGPRLNLPWQRLIVPTKSGNSIFFLLFCKLSREKVPLPMQYIV